MDILLVAATLAEAQVVQAYFSLNEEWELGFWRGNNRRLKLLVTGIGMVNTAYQLGKHFGREKPDLAIQFGIGGAFVGGPEMGEVVEIRKECLPELGAESPESFIDLEGLGFENFSFGGKSYYNEFDNPHPPTEELTPCSAVTVNTVHGRTDSIQGCLNRWRPQVESMEGAAFFQACLISDIPFLQVRAISNRVEARNRAAWDIPAALKALNEFTIPFIQGKLNEEP